MVIKADQGKLAILMPMVWSIRNLVHSGFLDYLKNLDIFLLLPNFDPTNEPNPVLSDLFRGVNCQSLIIPPVKSRFKGFRLLREIIQSAFSRRNKIGSYAIYMKWFSRNYSAPMRLRQVIVEFFGFLAQPAPIFFSLYGLYDKLYRKEYDIFPIKKQLKEINPAVLFTTVNVEDVYERAYVLAAKELGIPIINAILSFDNLTSKSAHLIYDYYLVWNRGMKDQLLHFYPQVRPEQVEVTGTPQFDFHRKPEFVWERDFTLSRLGLPVNSKYFLYGASPFSLTPKEPQLVKMLSEKMRQNEILRDYWLVVRTHPKDDWERWRKETNNDQRIIFSNAWDSTPDETGWTYPTTDDLARLTSSLAHSSACINIASTISLDAAILNRPVIGIDFENEPNAPREILYEEYQADHYRPLVESGGLRLAHNWEEMMNLMIDAIQFPNRDLAARQNMVQQECGVVDGNSARRLAAAVSGFAAKHRS